MKYPIHVACQAGRFGCVTELQQLGADIFSPSEEGSTPILLAAKKGCLACTKFLKRNGCNISKNDLDLCTGLAKVYLSDVDVSELACLINVEDYYLEELSVGIKARLNADLQAYIDEGSVKIILNPGTASQAGDAFITRHKQMNKSCTDSSPVRFLWHGCDTSIIGSILESGFKTSYSNLTFNVYGAGIYFATDAKLSAYFLTTNVRERKAYPPDNEGYYSILFSVVSLGRVGLREALCGGNEVEKTQMKSDLKHPANRNPPVGCNSAAGKYLKEVVIYENSQAFPLAQVKFRLKEGIKIPDPYAKDTETSREYLKSLHDVPTGLGRFCDTKGDHIFLDTSEIIIDDNPRLIMGWSAGNESSSEITRDDLVERIGELEMRVADLERENQALRISMSLNCP